MKNQTIFDITASYLKNHQVTYGTTISSIDILKEAGEHPKLDTSISCRAKVAALNSYYLDDYLTLAEKVADELVEQLKIFGFAADKVHRLDSSNVVPHIQGCTVYSRYPWDIYYKGRKAAQIAQSCMESIHDATADVEKLKERAYDVYDAGSKFLNVKQERAVEFTTNNARMWESFGVMHAKLMPKKDELSKEFRHLQPENYGNYGEEES